MRNRLLIRGLNWGEMRTDRVDSWFVVFAGSKAANAAMTEMDSNALDGRRVRVSSAQEWPPRSGPAVATAFFGDGERNRLDRKRGG